MSIKIRNEIKKYYNNNSFNEHNTPINNSNKKCGKCGLRNHPTYLCRHSSSKCFKCNEFGHLANTCTNQANSVNFCKQSNQRSLKNIKIQDYVFKALIDTGSDVNVISTDVYLKLGSPKLNDNTVNLSGIGDNKIKTFGTFQVDIHIDDCKFNSSIHVVSEKSIPYECIIGNELLSKANLNINNTGISITKIEENLEIMNINVNDEDEKNADLSHIDDKFNKEQIMHLIKSYKPVKTKKSNIETKIVVRDETPIYQRPRRLAMPEKVIVNDIINEWLNEGII